MVLYRICPGCRTTAGLAPAGAGGVCRPCLASVEPAEPIADLTRLDAAAALFRYDDVVQRIVVAAKNGGRRDVIRRLGPPLAQLVGDLDTLDDIDDLHRRRLGPFDLVTWVPASSRGRRRRGYDQGRLLARAVAAELGLHSRRLLLRRPGLSQAGLSREARSAGPELRAPLGCPRSVVLVDDVITTGASMMAAAEALRRAGARTVVGVAVARAPAYRPVSMMAAADREIRPPLPTDGCRPVL